MRVIYEQELNELNEQLKEMAFQVEEAIGKSFGAFERNDGAMAQEIIKGDRMVNDMERAIEARCLSLILKQTPVAGDLRIVSTALKVVTDLERIGDHASDIAELVLRLQGTDAYHLIDHLPVMAGQAKTMLHDAIDAFIRQDDERSRQVISRDDEIDWLFNQTKAEVAVLLRNNREEPAVDQAIDLLMIAKYLERIGDHAVNICEWAQFSKTGAVKNIRII